MVVKQKYAETERQLLKFGKVIAMLLSAPLIEECLFQVPMGPGTFSTSYAIPGDSNSAVSSAP